MVQAILEGRKTETRRTRGLDKINENPDAWQFKGIDHTGEYIFYNPTFYDEHNGLSIAIKCPYGQVGDQLWVRETWASEYRTRVYYKADMMSYGNCNEVGLVDGITIYDKKMFPVAIQHGQISKWKSPRFMFRWASRITTENTKIRVERVQEIDKKDKYDQDIGGGAWKEGFRCPCPTAAFMLYWESLNGKRGYGWIKNPWVWVIEFKDIKNEV
jgi:hypothetical protein